MLLKDLLLIREAYLHAGKTVVVANGVFDCLHPGHVDLLRFASHQGDVLFVLINSDESVKRLKGTSRPIVRQGLRAMVLSELRCVDAVFVFDEDTPAKLLKKLMPDILVKGADTPRPWPGEEFCGECIAAPYLTGFSTTAIAERIAQ